MNTSSPTPFRILLGSFLLLTAASLSAQAPRYSFVELGPLLTPQGDLDQIRAIDINNAGQVVGEAAVAAGPVPRRAAFRYTPNVGLEDLDPTGNYTSKATFINDAGQVFGEYEAAGNIPRRFFRYDGDGGFNLLEKGLKNEIRRRFRLTDMNEAGDLVGYLPGGYSSPNKPFLYSDRAGWVNLFVTPEFREGRGAIAQHINDRGDIVLSYGGGTALLRGDDLADVDLLLSSTGFSSWPIQVGRLSEGGHVAGVRAVPNRPALTRAALYTPGRKVRDIHPARFQSSNAFWVSSTGAVGGTLTRRTGNDTLFTYDPDRRPRMRVEATVADFRALLGGANFTHAFVFDANDRLDFIGFVRGPDDLWFVYFQDAGLVKVQDLLAEAGSDAVVVRAFRINDRREILVLVRPPDRPEPPRPLLVQPRYTRMVVLSPVPGT